VDVGVLDAPVDDLVLAADEPGPGGVVGRCPGNRTRRHRVDGPEQMHVPRLAVLREGDGRWRDDEILELDEEVLAALLVPPLLEVVEHVPGHGALEAAVDVVPGLPWAHPW